MAFRQPRLGSRIVGHGDAQFLASQEIYYLPVDLATSIAARFYEHQQDIGNEKP